MLTLALDALLAAAGCLLAVVDTGTTRLLLALGARELNPVVRLMMRLLGSSTALTVALVVRFYAFVLLAALGFTWVLVALVAVEALVVWHNDRVLEQVREEKNE